MRFGAVAKFHDEHRVEVVVADPYLIRQAADLFEDVAAQRQMSNQLITFTGDDTECSRVCESHCTTLPSARACRCSVFSQPSARRCRRLIPVSSRGSHSSGLTIRKSPSFVHPSGMMSSATTTLALPVPQLLTHK